MEDRAPVDLWRIGLDVPGDVRDRLWPVLADAERQQACRFHLARDAHRFIVAHGALRAIVARYLGCDPAAVVFVTGPNGKPELASRASAGLQFNLTHSHALALCAVTRQGRVGVDVERIRPDLATDDVARACFSAAEHRAWSALTAPLRADAFFACWTRREAYVKGRGEGLGAPSDGDDALGWRVVDLDVGPGYAGALAVEAPEVRIAWRQWRPGVDVISGTP